MKLYRRALYAYFFSCVTSFLDYFIRVFPSLCWFCLPMAWDYMSEEETRYLTYFSDIKVYSVAHILALVFGALGTLAITLLQYLLSNFVPPTCPKRGGYFSRSRNSPFMFWDVCLSFMLSLLHFTHSGYSRALSRCSRLRCFILHLVALGKCRSLLYCSWGYLFQ